MANDSISVMNESSSHSKAQKKKHKNIPQKTNEMEKCVSETDKYVNCFACVSVLKLNLTAILLHIFSDTLSADTKISINLLVIDSGTVQDKPRKNQYKKLIKQDSELKNHVAKTLK